MTDSGSVGGAIDPVPDPRPGTTGAPWPPAVATMSPSGSSLGGLTHNGALWTAGGAPLSSAGKRFGASVLDAVLMILTLYIGWVIWSLIIWNKGQSPAKALLGMRCVRTDTGKVAGWGTMALRELVGKSILGTITFGITSLVSCFMILGASHQGIWDKIATTVVVDDPDGRLVRVDTAGF